MSVAATKPVPDPAAGHVPPARRVIVLGSTGSIGRNTVELLAADPDGYEVEALVANSNTALLAQQARALGARLAVVAREDAREDLAARLAGTGIEVAAGRAAVIEAACRDAEWLMAAIVGVAGLEPTLAAARRGTTIALANKECLVSAGACFLSEAARGGAGVVPVDSEHSAIFQVLAERHAASLERIILTASGGPFRGWSRERMATVTRAEALRHPNWAMGDKVTIDSATMMNKGLELIEAAHLFSVSEDRLDVLVHPESVVHGLVAFADGSQLAQLGAPDMRTPIAVSLAWPRRMAAKTDRLDLAALGKLTFEAPDEAAFPALRIARDALRAGRGAPTVLNAANEMAVAAFLDGRIGFLNIAETVAAVLEAEANGLAMQPANTLEAVLEIDTAARTRAGAIIMSLFQS